MRVISILKGLLAVAALWAFIGGLVFFPNETVIVLMVLFGMAVSVVLFMMAAGD